MYKQLSDEQTASDVEYQLTPTRLTVKGELLDKAKLALYATMDGISESANHVSIVNMKSKLGPGGHVSPLHLTHCTLKHCALEVHNTEIYVRNIKFGLVTWYELGSDSVTYMLHEEK